MRPQNFFYKAAAEAAGVRGIESFSTVRLIRDITQQNLMHVMDMTWF